MIPLSVVMPAHNEAANIEAGIDEWFAEVLDRIPGSEMVVIDDCSTDDTGARLSALASRRPALRTRRTPSNLGHGPAVRLGLECSRGDLVFQTDSDRQFRPADFWALWEHRDRSDFVFGVRRSRADGPFRRAVAAGLRGANALLWREWIADANCPFKLMRRAPLDALLAEIPPDSFIPMVMLAVLARRRRYRVAEVPVRHFARASGQQSLTGALKWARVVARCTRELVQLRIALARQGGPSAAER